MSSSTQPPRIYVGGVSSRTREDDLQSVFKKYGKVARVDLKTGFAFIEFEDKRDAEDAVRGMDGQDLDGRRVSVEMARGPRRGGGDRSGPGGARPRGGHKLIVENLDARTSWQDLKDFARTAGNSVSYTDVFTERGKKVGVIEYMNQDDYREALRKLDGEKLDGARVRLFEDNGGSSRRSRSRSPKRSRSRSRGRRDRSRSRSPRRDDDRDRKRDRSRSRGRDDRDRDRDDRKERDSRDSRDGDKDKDKGRRD